MLHVIEYGTRTDAPSLLIAHGLFGSARNWGVISKRLSDTRHVVAVDMRNHGDSPWFDTHSYADMAADLAQVITQRLGGRADVLGHSMGGKAAMVLALTQPTLVNRLIVADIAPVGYSHTQMPMIEAMLRVNPADTDSRSAATQQLGVDDPGVAAFLLQSLDLKEQRWKLNLDALAAQMAQIIGFPDMDGKQFDGAALFLTGGQSTYLTPDGHDAVKSLFPHAKFEQIAGAGHWLHAEKPREFEAACRDFLAQ